MNLLQDERDEIMTQTGFLRCLAENNAGNARSAFCGTAFWGDKILCVGGWWEEAPGVCQMFIIPDAEMLKQHPKVFALTTIKWRKKVEEFKIYHRIQALSLPGMSRWMQVIGFEYEGLMRHFSKSGKSYELWSKIL